MRPRVPGRLRELVPLAQQFAHLATRSRLSAVKMRRCMPGWLVSRRATRIARDKSPGPPRLVQVPLGNAICPFPSESRKWTLGKPMTSCRLDLHTKIVQRNGVFFGFPLKPHTCLKMYMMYLSGSGMGRLWVFARLLSVPLSGQNVP